MDIRYSLLVRLLSSTLEFTPGAGFSVSLPGVFRRLAPSISLRKSVIQSCIFLFFMHVFSIGRSQHLYFQGVMRLFDWPNFLVAAKGRSPRPRRANPRLIKKDIISVFSVLSVADRRTASLGHFFQIYLKSSSKYGIIHLTNGLGSQ